MNPTPRSPQRSATSIEPLESRIAPAAVLHLVSNAADDASAAGNSLSDAVAVSANGRYVGFFSFASNLVANDVNAWQDFFVKDLQTGQTVLVSTSSEGVIG